MYSCQLVRIVLPKAYDSHFHTGTTGIPSSVPSSSYVISRHFQSSCALAYFISGALFCGSGLLLDAVRHLNGQLVFALSLFQILYSFTTPNSFISSYMVVTDSVNSAPCAFFVSWIVLARL